MDLEHLISSAAAVGRVDQIKELLAKEPGLAKCYDPDGWTPLHVACHFGQAESARVLLEAGADPVARSTNHFKNHPIHTAVAGANPELISLLIEWGADPDATETGGLTPLHRAAEKGDVQTMEALLEAGADPDSLDDSGKSAVLIALENENETVMMMLREYHEKRAREN